MARDSTWRRVNQLIKIRATAKQENKQDTMIEIAPVPRHMLIRGEAREKC